LLEVYIFYVQTYISQFFAHRYLPSDTGKRASLTGTRFTDPAGIDGWVDFKNDQYR